MAGGPGEAQGRRCSARGRGHLVIVRALEQSWVAAVHLQRRLAGDVRRAATPCPCIRVQELPRVVGAVAQAGPVEARVRPVNVLGGVSLHEQVHGHHPGTLEGREEKQMALFALLMARKCSRGKLLPCSMPRGPTVNVEAQAHLLLLSFHIPHQIMISRPLTAPGMGPIICTESQND